jgi:hypothetical protein
LFYKILFLDSGNHSLLSDHMAWRNKKTWVTTIFPLILFFSVTSVHNPFISELPLSYFNWIMLSVSQWDTDCFMLHRVYHLILSANATMIDRKWPHGRWIQRPWEFFSENRFKVYSKKVPYL